jgi:hypothetical protein
VENPEKVDNCESTNIDGIGIDFYVNESEKKKIRWGENYVQTFFTPYSRFSTLTWGVKGVAHNFYHHHIFFNLVNMEFDTYPVAVG